MRQENPTLSIKDIVLLKERPQDYYKLQDRLTKTHDGTSSGPINNHIRDFIAEHKNDAFRCVAVFDKNGNLIEEVTNGIENDMKQEVPVYSKYDLEELGTDNHIIYKPTMQDNSSHVGTQLPYENYDNRYKEESIYLDVPNEDDLERLTYTNADGESLVRSITLMGWSGGNDGRLDPTVTIIKNNKYTAENEEALMEAGQKLNDVVSEYDSKKWNIEREIIKEWENEQGMVDGWFIDQNGERHSSLYHPDYKRISKEAYETAQSEMPDVFTYIEESGVYGDFENANAKLKIRKNGGIEPKSSIRYSDTPYNQQEYEEAWAEAHDEEFYNEPYEPDW